MSRIFVGTKMTVTSCDVCKVVCDGCGATRPDKDADDWMTLNWPWLDDQTYWYEGCGDGPWDFCSMPCLQGFVGVHKDALKT